MPIIRAASVAALALPGPRRRHAHRRCGAVEYPTRVKIMVGASPAAAPTSSRACSADKFQAALRKPFVVENRPGASNTIAADADRQGARPTAHAALATNTGQAIAPHLMKLGFDPIKDLGRSRWSSSCPTCSWWRRPCRYTNVRDLIAAHQGQPGQFAYGSSGVGSTQHLAGEAFNLAAGTRPCTCLQGLPRRRSRSRRRADPAELRHHVVGDGVHQGGKVKALAVMSPKRTPELPDVPTLTEAGFPASR